MKFTLSGVATKQPRERFDGSFNGTIPSIAKFREICILTTAVFLN